MNKKEDFNMALGRRLMILRQSKQVSQEYLGSCIGVRGQQIHKYETGENKMTPERLMRCALILGVPVGYFYGESEVKNANQNYDKVVMNVAAEIIELPRDIRQGVYHLTKAINARIKKG
ncbi:MAG: helix-turn-helix transcriptional regulator [Alphaproteobacteria bacterium]|nr:helix-turn-helix transcriptional regulator [Alphaproteobacteria bacterium]